MFNEIIQSEIVSMVQVVGIDLVLAGDNAIVVGMAACGVAPEQRSKVICLGILGAVLLRITFAAVTTQLLTIIGLTLAGGILLIWVCWKLYRELQEQQYTDASAELLEANLENTQCSDGVPLSSLVSGGTAAISVTRSKSMSSAIWQVTIADLSMSLDNVLAVAGAAGKHMIALILGLVLSVALMGIGAALIARILQRHRWLAYVGLVLIAYVAGRMIIDGSTEISRAMAGL